MRLKFSKVKRKKSKDDSAIKLFVTDLDTGKRKRVYLDEENLFLELEVDKSLFSPEEDGYATLSFSGRPDDWVKTGQENRTMSYDYYEDGWDDDGEVERTPLFKDEKLEFWLRMSVIWGMTALFLVPVVTGMIIAAFKY